MYIVNNWVR